MTDADGGCTGTLVRGATAMEPTEHFHFLKRRRDTIVGTARRVDDSGTIPGITNWLICRMQPYTYRYLLAPAAGTVYISIIIKISNITFAFAWTVCICDKCVCVSGRLLSW